MKVFQYILVFFTSPPSLECAPDVLNISSFLLLIFLCPKKHKKSKITKLLSNKYENIHIISFIIEKRLQDIFHI